MIKSCFSLSLSLSVLLYFLFNVSLDVSSRYRVVLFEAVLLHFRNQHFSLSHLTQRDTSRGIGHTSCETKRACLFCTPRQCLVNRWEQISDCDPRWLTLNASCARCKRAPPLGGFAKGSFPRQAHPPCYRNMLSVELNLCSPLFKHAAGVPMSERRSPWIDAIASRSWITTTTTSITFEFRKHFRPASSRNRARCKCRSVARLDWP